jgi:hypothetical protein
LTTELRHKVVLTMLQLAPSGTPLWWFPIMRITMSLSDWYMLGVINDGCGTQL